MATDAEIDRAFEKHELVPLFQVGDPGSLGYEGWHLRVPGSNVGDTVILFTPRGIVLLGDRVPEGNGSVSSPRCSRTWFSNKLSRTYLCGNFLQKDWHASLAAKEIRDMADEAEKEGYVWDETDEDIDDIETLEDIDMKLSVAEVLRRLAEEIECLDVVEHTEMATLLAAVSKRCPSVPTFDGEPLPGYGYNPNAADWLCGIQRAFARLMAARVKAEKEPT